MYILKKTTYTSVAILVQAHRALHIEYEIVFQFASVMNLVDQF